MSMIKKICALAVSIILIFSFTACGTDSAQTAPAEEVTETDASQTESKSEEPVAGTEISSEKIKQTEEENMEKSLHFYIDENEVEVVWEKNASVDALIKLAEISHVTVQMSMYGGFEQVGSLGGRLPSSDVRTATSAGDIVLYSSSQIVIFYGSNSWAYTRLGKVADKTSGEMAELLGNGDVTVRISYE